MIKKRICLLLAGELDNDARVIKTANSLSKEFDVDVFYFSNSTPKNLGFPENVRQFCSPRKVSFFTKLLQHTFFVFEYTYLVEKVQKINSNYNFIYSNDLPTLFPAFILKRRYNAKLIYDSHEIYLESIKQFFPKTQNVFKKLLYLLSSKIMRASGYIFEKYLLKQTDAFITVSNSLKKYFNSIYNKSDINVVMNCPTKSEDEIILDLKVEFKIPKSGFLLLYQGGFNPGRGLEDLLVAMSKTNENIYLILLGDGHLKSELIKLQQKYGMENKVYFKSYVEYSKLLAYTRSADCGICLLEDINLNTRYGSPNKLFEYIQAGIPIIASKSVELESAFSLFKLGLLTDNNPSALSSVINEMALSDKAPYIEESKNAANEFCWEKQEEILITTIQSLNS